MTEITITAKTLDDIQKAVSKLAKRIGAPDALLPTYGRSMDFAHPHIEFDPRGFHFVVVERGQEQARKTTQDPTELVYWVFESVTFEMACDFELHHRREGEDFRRLLFSKQEDLLANLDSSWCDRRAACHRQVLAQHPFDDMSSTRVLYSKELTDAGTSASKAWTLACEKYPLPN